MKEHIRHKRVNTIVCARDATIVMTYSLKKGSFILSSCVTLSDGNFTVIRGIFTDYSTMMMLSDVQMSLL